MPNPIPPPSCTWLYDPDEEVYWTSCNNTFVFTEGGPADNDFEYCPYCGAPLTPTYQEEESE